MNETARKKSYGSNLLSHGGPHTYKKEYDASTYYKDCCLNTAVVDFEHIFRDEEENVIYELLSFYILALEGRSLSAGKDASAFRADANDVFAQFGVDYALSDSGFVPRQEKKIMADVWDPTIKALTDRKWQAVDRELSEAFVQFRLKKPEGYSAALTHSINALQAYLQIEVHGKTGKGDILELIAEASKRGSIPNDELAATLLKNVESVLARVRMQSGNAHPKQVHASEQTALFVLNLVMTTLHYLISPFSKNAK